MSKIKTLTELKHILDQIPMDKIPDKKALVCSIIGHSNIISTCFGYIHCGRCEDQIGDSLGGAYSNDKSVIIGHDCPTCRKNYKKLTWKDRYLVKNPFKKN